MRFIVSSFLILLWISFDSFGEIFDAAFYISFAGVQLLYLRPDVSAKANLPAYTILFFGVCHLTLVQNPRFFLIFVLVYFNLALTSIGHLDFRRWHFGFINSLVCLSFIFVNFNNDLVLNFSIDAFLKSETSTWENNHHPFLFLLFFIYSLERKYWFLVFLNAAFIILSFKRVVFIGSLMSLVVLFTDLRKTKRILLIPFILLLFSFSLSWPNISDFVEENTGLYMSHLTQGRSVFYNDVISNYLDWNTLIFGAGLTNVTSFSVLRNEYLLHNDLLKVFLELGLIGFLIIQIGFYRLLRVSYYIPLMLLFSTDNVLVYLHFLYFLTVFNLKSANVE